MKTRFTTLAAVAALFVIGATNINATADYKKAMNEEIAVESESSLSIEEWMTNDDYWTTETTVEAERPLKVESWMTSDCAWK